MKIRFLATAALVATIGFVMPVKAQNSDSGTPSEQSQLSPQQILAACAQDRAETLPNPYSRDLSPNHWAFKAVLSMHYCGAYRGSIPPDKYLQILQQQQQKPLSTKIWEPDQIFE